ncbi:hypothetical protein MMC18_003474 [Xylographa bjoerkii]|nr:hypothetical protein [Xylographa bjoerkii]
MSQFAPSQESLASLRGKVVVLTGGANGIGAATVRLLFEAGASVVFGDMDTKNGELLVEGIRSQEVLFMKTDASKYEDNLALFKTAYQKFGKVDHAMSIAGIVEQGNWFDPSLTIESVEKARRSSAKLLNADVPTKAVLDVNLLGVLYFARIASVYLRQNRKEGEDKSLTLLSSVAGFKESPGLFVYQAAKHGVLGLMRTLRPYLPVACNIRVNAICPWMTATAIVAGIEEEWYKAKLPVNQPVHVAKVIMDVTRSEGLNGKAMYIEGGRAWEIEDNLNRLEPHWMGEEPSRSLAKGQELLGNGTGWTSKQKY